MFRDLPNCTTKLKLLGFDDGDANKIFNILQNSMINTVNLGNSLVNL